MLRNLRLHWGRLPPTTRGLIIISVVCWAALLAESQRQSAALRLCGPSGASDPITLASVTPWQFLAFGDLTALLLSWILMIGAMMLPTLTGPAFHLWHRSLARHRSRALGLFLLGYVVSWLGACAGLFLLALAGIGVLGRGVELLGLTLLAALLWQLSPAKRACLQRCHRRKSLAIFGPRALLDPVLFGCEMALWCVGSCWALMLLPFCVPDFHLGVMFAVTAIILAERLFGLGSRADLARLWQFSLWRIGQPATVRRANSR
jgi:predicted metal-binding membrane protein